MGKTIIVKPNQSMLDVVLQAMGSIEAGIAFCSLNNVSISDMPEVGAIYIIPEAESVEQIIDKSVLKYYSLNSIIAGTLGRMPPRQLELTVVLKPKLESHYEGPFPPPVLGYYQIGLSASPGFINVNSLLTAYPFDNEMYYQESADMVAALPPANVTELTGLPMPVKHLAYHIPRVSMGNVFVWNPHTAGQTITFEDTFGNRACFAPVLALYDSMPPFYEQLIADLQLEFVATDGYTATLRLTRSHVPALLASVNPPGGHMNMQWLPSSVGLYEDPDNPGNPDVQLIDLYPGVYTFGIETEYTDDVANFTWAAKSICTQVIMIA